MMSPETIREMETEARKKAAKAGAKPFVIWEQDLALGRKLLGSFPFIGDYVPPGWIPVADFFVDSSGMGQPGEAALTIDEFLEVVAASIGSGFAITSAGQFQVYVTRFERV